MARKTAGLLVTQAGCRFLDGGSVAQQFQGIVLALIRQPDLGVHARLLEEIPMQCAHGNVAQFRQCRGRPLCLPRKFGPVLDMLQFGIHKWYICNWFIQSAVYKRSFCAETPCQLARPFLQPRRGVRVQRRSPPGFGPQSWTKLDLSEDNDPYQKGIRDPLGLLSKKLKDTESTNVMYLWAVITNQAGFAFRVVRISVANRFETAGEASFYTSSVQAG